MDQGYPQTTPAEWDAMDQVARVAAWIDQVAARAMRVHQRPFDAARALVEGASDQQVADLKAAIRAVDADLEEGSELDRDAIIIWLTKNTESG